MTFNAFEVVVVPFPFTDRDASKRRPALVRSTPTFNNAHEQLVLGMITTTEQVWPSDVALSGWKEAGLNTACRFRLKLFTLDQSLIVRTTGRLTGDDQQTVQASLRQHLV